MASSDEVKRASKLTSTVLLTGGAGFIGSHVVDELVGFGCRVVVLDDLSGGYAENVNPQAEFAQGSINDVTLINDLFERYDFDFVFHLAAYAAEGLSHFIKRFNYENNLIGSVNLLNAAINHEIKCFVFTSSIAVYGTQPPPMREEMRPAPVDSYGIAKFAVEQELKICREMFDLNYIVFRPHNVFGERQNLSDKYRNVIGIFIDQIMQGKPLTIFGDGEQTRAFSYIKEVAPIIARSVFQNAAYNQIFNLGSDAIFTVNEIARSVCQAMGVELKVEHLAERTEVKHAYCSHEKAARVFKLNHPYSFNEGLKRMVDWAKHTGRRKGSQFEAIEVRKRLPASWSEPDGR
jgi:UDP-glucose 4-epimerase